MIKIGWTWALAAGAAVYGLPGCAPQTGTGSTIDPINGSGAGTSTNNGAANGTAGAGGGSSTYIAGTGSSVGTSPGNLGMPTGRPADMGKGPDGSCGALPFTAQQVTKTQTITHTTPEPIDLYLMWDQSGSMNCPTSSGAGGAGGAGSGNTDRWDAVKAPLSAWVQSVAADPPFNVGIGYFGLPQTNIFMPNPNECTASSYEKPDVEIGPLPQNAMPIVNSLNAHMPSTGTPTKAALQGAANHALAWKMSHPNDVVAVVLVTDGVPNSCGTVQDVADTAAMAWNNGMGVRTFVIGVTSPGVTCPVDPDPPKAEDLDTIAAAGGTTKALIVDVTQDASKQLTDELNMIRQSITMTTTKTEVMTSKLACEYTLPMMAMDIHDKVVFDRDKVNVDFTSNHGMKMSAYRVDSMDKCSSTNALAWYYDNNDTPTQILLCPNACSQIQAPSADGGIDPTIAGTAPTVSIVLGCKTIYAPPA